MIGILARRMRTRRVIVAVTLVLGASGCSAGGPESWESDADRLGEAAADVRSPAGRGLDAPIDPARGVEGLGPEGLGPEGLRADSEVPLSDRIPARLPEDTVNRFRYDDGDLALCNQGAYFSVQGDLHAHTHHSDGHYDPHTAFRVARECGMDFFTVTDHVRATNTMTPAEWSECRSDANAADEPGAFVAFCGFEVEPVRGHANVFFSDEIWTASSRSAFATKLNGEPGNGVAGQINHPCTATVDNQWGPYPESDGALPFPYNAAIDDNMALMEFSGGGNFPCKQQEYTYLLDTGWHIAPSNNGDRHGTDQDWCAEPVSRTGFWVTELSREGIHSAMRRRRSFSAPHGSSIRLLADGCWMGSVVGGVSTASVLVEASHAGGLTSIVLVGNQGGTLGTCDCADAATCTCAQDLTVGAGSYVYAYAPRTDNTDKPLVAAPVWFRETPTCSGECTAGAVESQDCGNCGTQSRRCRGNCSWGPWGDCEGVGPCASGQTETDGCGDCGTTARECQTDCSWGAWAACQGSGAEETIPCGNCGHQTVVCALDGTAASQSECEGTGPCAPGEVETQPVDDCGAAERTCQEDCQWPAASACPLSEEAGCGCRQAGSRSGPATWALALGGTAIVLGRTSAKRRQRRRKCSRPRGR